MILFGLHPVASEIKRTALHTYFDGSVQFVIFYTKINQPNEYLFQMKKITYSKNDAWHIVLLLVRIWLGYRLCGASYSSIVDIIFHPKERAFFEKWFGDELHFPLPVVMAFLAKGAEFLGGVLIFIGLFTRASALLIAFTMLVATLTANLGENFIIDGGFTISYFMFALILIIQGSGKYSLDYFRLKRIDYTVA